METKTTGLPTNGLSAGETLEQIAAAAGWDGLFSWDALVAKVAALNEQADFIAEICDDAGSPLASPQESGRTITVGPVARVEWLVARIAELESAARAARTAALEEAARKLDQLRLSIPPGAATPADGFISDGKRGAYWVGASSIRALITTGGAGEGGGE